MLLKNRKIQKSTKKNGKWLLMMAVDDDSGVLQIAGIGQIFVCEEFMSQAIEEHSA